MSAYIKFEELLPLFCLSGKVDVIEGPPPKGLSSSVIRTDQPWRVDFDWTTSGPLNYIMHGTWELSIYLELMGGKEFDFDPGKGKSSVSFVAKPNNYKSSILVPPNEVPAGIYRVVASVTMKGIGGVPGPIAGFAEAGLVQFYEGGPIGA